MAFQLNRLDGKDGKVTIKGLGSLVAEVATWTLTRRGDSGPKAGLFDLRAVFSFLVPNLILDPDYSEDRELVLYVSKGQSIKVRLNDPAQMVLQGKVLSMEGVEIAWSQR